MIHCKKCGRDDNGKLHYLYNHENGGSDEFYVCRRCMRAFLRDRPEFESRYDAGRPNNDNLGRDFELWMEERRRPPAARDLCHCDDDSRGHVYGGSFCRLWTANNPRG